MATAEFTAQDIINAQTNAKIEILAQEMKDFKEEMRDFKDEMRDFKNEMRQQNSEIRQSIDSMGKHVRNLSITAMAGIGAMFITSTIGIAAMIWSVVNK